MNPNIVKAACFRAIKDLHDTIDKGFAGDKTDGRVLPCLPEQMLAAAKPDLKPDVTCYPKQVGQLIRRWNRQIECELA